MIYPRKLYPSLKKHLSAPEVTVLTGMRRVGKTTLVRQLLTEVGTANQHYFDLERLDNRELFSEKNYDTILTSFVRLGLDVSKRPVIALDEIQLIPHVTGVIKYLYDHYHIKFLVTGSSSYYLKHLFRESLAGRKKIFELTPLDFGEYLTFQGQPSRQRPLTELPFESSEYERLKADYEAYILFGGFPDVALAKSFARKRDLLLDIISSYMSVDIKTLADLKDEQTLYRLIKMLAGRCGSRLDVSKLSRLTGISRPTVMNYLELLEKTYLIRRLPVFSANVDRQIVKTRKLYFTDTGLLNVLADPGAGVLFENAVVNQFAKRGSLTYWADKTGREVDLVIDGAVAIEVKETPTIDDALRLKRLAQAIGITESYLVGRHPTPTYRNFLWGGSIQ